MKITLHKKIAAYFGYEFIPNNERSKVLIVFFEHPILRFYPEMDRNKTKIWEFPQKIPSKYILKQNRFLLFVLLILIPN